MLHTQIEINTYRIVQHIEKLLVWMMAGAGEWGGKNKIKKTRNETSISLKIS